MNKKTTLLIVALAFFPLTSAANDSPPKDFHELESPPKISFDWPTVRVESVKYHLARRFLKSNSYLFPILIKEKHQSELTDGREGTRSRIVLEMWELGVKSVEKKIWRISQEADEWKYSGWDELVLIKYGCCDSPNKYIFYDLKTGSLLRSVEGTELPVNN